MTHLKNQGQFSIRNKETDTTHFVTVLNAVGNTDTSYSSRAMLSQSWHEGSNAAFL